MALFETLGFRWDRSALPQNVPQATVDRVLFRFHRMLPEYLWDAGMLEGNPSTFPEIKTLLEGVTLGGRKLSDQEQILNLAEASRRLMRLVRLSRFALDRVTFCELQAIVAGIEALERGISAEKVPRHASIPTSLWVSAADTPFYPRSPVRPC